MSAHENKLPLSRGDWTLSRYLLERSRDPMPPIARASDDVLHIAKLAVNAPLPRAVYIVGENDQYLGVIVDTDLAREVFGHLDPNLSFDPEWPSLKTILRVSEDASELTALSLMSDGGPVLNEHDTLASAMRQLYRVNREELPVVNGVGKLVGVIRALDILREWVDDTLLMKFGDETESFY